MDIHLLDAAPTAAERAAVEHVLGPPSGGWDGGARDSERQGHSLEGGGHEARSRRHLLLPVRENRQKLTLLLGREIQFFSQPPKLLARVGTMASRRHRRSLLRQRGCQRQTGAKNNAESEQSKLLFHEGFLSLLLKTDAPPNGLSLLR